MSLVLVSTGQQFTLNAGAPTFQQSLICRGFPSGALCRRLRLELVISTIVRGGVPVAHEPEELSQLINSFTLLTSDKAPATFKPQMSGINGQIFDFLYRFRNSTRNNLNRVLGAAAVSGTHYWEIPFVPNLPGILEKGSRPYASWLDGLSLEVTNSLAPFDMVNDITSITGFFRVWAQVERVDASHVPTPGGIVIQTNNDFVAIDKQEFNTYAINMLVLRNRTAYSRLNLMGGQFQYYTTLTPLEIDQLGEENRYYLHTETRTAFQGDPMAFNIPHLNTGGVSAPETHLVAADIRNQKDLSIPLTLQAIDRNAAIPWYAMGWQV